MYVQIRLLWVAHLFAAAYTGSRGRAACQRHEQQLIFVCDVREVSKAVDMVAVYILTATRGHLHSTATHYRTWSTPEVRTVPCIQPLQAQCLPSAGSTAYFCMHAFLIRLPHCPPSLMPGRAWERTWKPKTGPPKPCMAEQNHTRHGELQHTEISSFAIAFLQACTLKHNTCIRTWHSART